MRIQEQLQATAVHRRDFSGGESFSSSDAFEAQTTCCCTALPQVRIAESNYHFSYYGVKEKPETMISLIKKSNRIRAKFATDAPQC